MTATDCKRANPGLLPATLKKRRTYGYGKEKASGLRWDMETGDEASAEQKSSICIRKTVQRLG